ncbi:MAG: hypothetical protein R3D81_07715 [Thalassovita sp.]
MKAPRCGSFWACWYPARRTRGAAGVGSGRNAGAVLGALKAGVVPIPLNTLLAASVYDVILRDSRAAALFVSEALYPVVAPALEGNPFLREVVILSDAAPQGQLPMMPLWTARTPFHGRNIRG